MENVVDYKVKVGYDGRVAVVLSFASESPSLLGAEASGAKNALVKSIPAVKSGAEASFDETGAIKNDPALKPVIKNDPALKPVTQVATAFKPAATGGAPQPSIKELPGETPAPAGDADWTVSAKEFPQETRAPAGISEWTTPSKSRRNNERKGASAPIHCSNGYGALGAGGIVGGADTGKAPSKVTRGSTPSTTNSGAAVNVETTTIPTTTTTPEGSASASDWFSMFCWPNALCTVFIFLIALVLSGAAVAYSAHGSRGLVSNVMPDVTALDPMPEPNSGLLFASPDRHPTFAPRPTPPVSNPVDDPNWLVAASGFCSDLSSTPVTGGGASIDFKFHPEVSVAFTDAPFHQAASLEDGIEIRGEEYSQTDVLAAGTWTNKNIALLEPTSSCDDPPAGSQDEWAISVFKVTGNEACGEECVHFAGLVSSASDNFVARKEGRFLCQLFVESHTFSDQARRSLRRRMAPTPLMTDMHMQPTARQPAFAPVPDIDLTASWLVAAAGICSDLSVTPKTQNAGAESAADTSGTFVADIKFQFHPETSVAYTMSPDRGAVEIGDDGVVVGDKAYTAVDVLSAAVWDLKNIALLEPTSSCDEPPAGSQDEWAISVFKVNTSDKCGAECVLYSGRVSSSSLDSFVQKKGRFPCQLYVDSTSDRVGGLLPPRGPTCCKDWNDGDTIIDEDCVESSVKDCVLDLPPYSGCCPADACVGDPYNRGCKQYGDPDFDTACCCPGKEYELRFAGC